MIGIGKVGGERFEDDAIVSRRWMRRSMIILALRIETTGSIGCNERVTDTRSSGPTGVVGMDKR
jgi:hypothetical protein